MSDGLLLPKPYACVIGLSATSGKTNYVVLLDTFRKSYFQ